MNKIKNKKTDKLANIKIGLLGSSGKMGQAIRQVLAKEGFSCFLEISKKPTSTFVHSYSHIHAVPNHVLQSVTVWIDFSRAEGLIELLKKIEKIKTPVVSGSTGLNEQQQKTLQSYAKKAPLFWASNMSMGLWSIRQAIKMLGAVSHFDFAIDEIHHTQKVDNPSGTAVTLQNDLEATIGKKIERPRGHRLGGVFGIHTVIGASQSEIIKLEHVAMNRTVFAEGAVAATKWIASRPKGLYSMDDLMKNMKRKAK